MISINFLFINQVLFKELVWYKIQDFKSRNDSIIHLYVSTWNKPVNAYYDIGNSGFQL